MAARNLFILFVAVTTAGVFGKDNATTAHPKAGKTNCRTTMGSAGDPDFYIYTQEATLDRVIRGEYPWPSNEGFRDYIGRARDFIASKKDLTQSQNERLWDHFSERISTHTQGHMKCHKVMNEDGTLIVYSDLLQRPGDPDDKKFFYYFAFTEDGGMQYGIKNARYFPMTETQPWQDGHFGLKKLK